MDLRLLFDDQQPIPRARGPPHIGNELSQVEATPMDLSHVHVFTAALQRKDLDTMLAQMSERIILETPLFAEPVRGKVAIREAVGSLLAIVERIQFQETLVGPRSVSGFYKVTIGSDTLDGMDYWQLDASGLIEHMRVLWRPLPALVAAQRRLEEAR